jgi:hypothetical protein
METKRLLPILIVVLGLGIAIFPSYGENTDPKTQVMAETGKTFTSSQDPEFVKYDQALREYVAKRINKQYGLKLDPKAYSGFNLLEIEAFLKCKKSIESVDLFLKKVDTRP